MANEKPPLEHGNLNLDAHPSRQERLSKFPTPAPRKIVHISEHHIEKGNLNTPGNRSVEVINEGNVFSEIHAEHAAVKVTHRSDSNSCDEINNKVPSKSGTSSLSPGRFSPVPYRKKKDLLENSEVSDKSSVKSLNVVSVFERSKLFEQKLNPLSAVSPQGSKPLKPPTPLRKEKLNKKAPSEKLGCTKVNSNGMVPPPCPPLKQSLLTGKQESAGTNSDHGEHVQAENMEKSTDKKPLMPPVKPQRTGAHDEYMKLKKQNASPVTFVIENNENIDTKTKINDRHNVKTSNEKFLTMKAKPLRPPPPLNKPRSYSVVSDGCNLDYKFHDGSDPGEEDKSHNFFYEVTSDIIEKPMHIAIQHWDLPRILHPEPIRRSLSGESIQKAVDEEGKTIYLDSNNLLGRGDYDIYIDSGGYAVPNRIIKRKGSVVESAEPSKPIEKMVKSKIKHSKNFFTDSPDTEKVMLSGPKAKLHVIRHKVSQAFEILNSSYGKPPTWESFDMCDDESDKKQTNESDNQIEEVNVEKYIEYCHTIRIRTSHWIKESRKLQEKIYPQLFELGMIVGLELNHDTCVYKPYIIYKFPDIHNYRLTMEGKLFPFSDLDKIDASIPLFCFPDAANFKPSSSSPKSQSYNFVLTHVDAQRLYGYCRRFTPLKSPNKTPEVICILSPINAFLMYNTLLEEIEKKRLISMDVAQELIAAAFGRPLPHPGHAETIKTLNEHGEMENIYLNRETDSRCENVSCECLLTLGSETLLKVFSTMLLERSILFCAKQLSTLSSTIHALASLLYPLSWQHTFIPVLPSEMLDVICSPTPYIIGITVSLMQKALSLALDEHVMVIDIDKKSLLKSQGDENRLLPPKILKALKISLNMCKIDADAKSYPSLMISESFLRFFVETIGHYGDYIVKQNHDQNVFQKEEFIKGAHSESLAHFLEWLVETQMFDAFITRQIGKPKGNTLEYFDTSLKEYKFTSHAFQ